MAKLDKFVIKVLFRSTNVSKLNFHGSESLPPFENEGRAQRAPHASELHLGCEAG